MNTYLVEIFDIQDNKAGECIVTVDLSEQLCHNDALNADLSCYSISIDKRMNDISTGLIRLHMAVKDKSTGDIRDFFLRKLVSVSFVNSDNTKKQVITNFYVSDITIKSDCNVQTYFVDLKICSPDNYLTFRKYSKVHTSKKLGIEIFKKEIEEQFGSLFQINYDGLRLLKYSYSEKNEEYIHPYLVQYNESFYDFLLRTANRCGEFLYFENGMLNLGLTKSDATSDFSGYAFMELKNEGVRSTNDNNEFHATGFDISNSNDTPLVSSIANDEYLEVVKKGEFDSTSKEMELLTPIDADILGTYGKYGNLIEGSAEMAWEETQRATSSLQFANMDNDYFDDQYFGTISDKNRYSSDSESYSLFTTYMDGETADGFTHSDDFGKRFSANYYSVIAKCQEEIKSCMVVASFPKQSTDYPDYVLGQEVNLDNERHIIYNIHIDANVSQHQWDNNVVMTLIPAVGKNDIPVAPLSSSERIRKVSGTQMAVVMDNMDPKYLGRVRVKYTWQKDDNWTPWIKVMAGLATKKGTVYFQPQVGDYVIVDYENGNIELPFVAGSVFTKNAPPKWGTRKFENVISCPNGHSIRISSQKDTTMAIASLSPALDLLKCMFPTIGVLDLSDDKIARGLTGGIEITDDYNLYSISTSSDHRAVKMDSAVGDIDFEAFNGITISAPKADLNITGKNINITAKNELIIHSGERAENLSTTILGIAATITSIGLDMLWDPTMLDLNSLRNVIEMFIRPVNGSLRISSTRYTMFEAGPGKIALPRNSYAPEKAKAVSGTALSIAATTVKIICDAADKALENYLGYYDRIYTSFPIIKDYLSSTYGITYNEKSLESVLSDIKLKDGNDDADSVEYFHEVLLQYNIDKWKITRLGIRMRSSISNFAKRGKFKSINRHIWRLAEGIKEIALGNFAYTQSTTGNYYSLDYDAFVNYSKQEVALIENEDTMSAFKKLKVLVGKEESQKFYTNYTNQIISIVRDAVEENGVMDANHNKRDAVNFATVINVNRNEFIKGKRKLAFEILKAFAGKDFIKQTNDKTFQQAEGELNRAQFNDTHWNQFINEIIPSYDDEGYDTTSIPSGPELFSKWKQLAPQTYYSSPSEGQVLFSDQAGKTFQLGEGKFESVENKMFFIRNVLTNI